jgi:hypothetical protein
MKQYAKMCFLVALVLLVTGIMAMAQSDTARVIGTVVDPSGAAVPGATITATNLSTNRVVTTQSQANGEYSVNSLPIGPYRIEARRDAFKTDSANVTLDISQVQEVNFKLQVGSTRETVNVSDEVALVDTATSSAGEVIQGRQVVELPLNGRNFTSLALMTPGVSRGSYVDTATGSQGNAETWRNSESGGAALAVNGLRPQANNYLLDGIDNNDSLVNTIVIYPAIEDIAEFKVTTSVPQAEFGRAGGAIIQVGTKAGSNTYHGSAYWFRRSGEGAALPFDSLVPQVLRRNQFGASLGGALWKNKVFGFVDYQGWRQSTPQSDGPTRVPTLKMRTGDFSELLGPNATATSVPYQGLPGCGGLYSGTSVKPQFAAGNGYIYNPQTCLPFGWDSVTNQPGASMNIIPIGNQNKIGMRYLNAFPLPNISGADVATNGSNFQPNRQQLTNRDDYDARLDVNVSAKDSVFARYSLGQDLLATSDRLVDSGHDLPSGFGSGSNPQHPRQVAVGYTRILNNNLINEFHYAYSRPYFGYQQPGFGGTQAANLGIPNANTSPLLGGMALIGGWKGEVEYVGDYGPYVVKQQTNQFADSVSWTTGRHTLKFGINVIHRDVDFTQANEAKGYFWIDDNNSGGLPAPTSGFGTFTGHEISELAGGFVGGYGIGVFNGYFKTRNWENGVFAQDDFRVNRKLILNLGLRYDLFTWPTEANNKQSNFDPTTGTLVEAGSKGSSPSLINTPKHNFGPRIGFAYNLDGNGKTVVRGGYGLFYYMDRGGVGVQLSNNPDFNGTQTYAACPSLTSCASGGRYTLSGAGAPGSTDPTLATGPLPVGQITLNPKSLASSDNVIYYPKNSPNSNIQQWNLQIERALGGQTSVNLAYVGTKMDNVATYFNANNEVFGATTNWFTNVGQINEYGFIGSGNYNGLQARLNHKMSKGLQYTVAYTWSHTLDNSNSALSSVATNPDILIGANGKPLLNTNYGNSNTDQRQLFVASVLYELPFGKGRAYLNDIPKVLDYAIGGWQWNNILVLASGTPIDITGASQSSTVGHNTRPNYNGGCSIDASFNVWLKCPAGAFTDPAPGTVGNLARNYFHGPGTHTLDTMVSKTVSVTERVKTEFRAQVYNLFNTPQLQSPDTNYNDAPSITSTSASGFGVIGTPRTGTNREIELAIRVSF